MVTPHKVTINAFFLFFGIQIAFIARFFDKNTEIIHKNFLYHGPFFCFMTSFELSEKMIELLHIPAKASQTTKTKVGIQEIIERVDIVNTNGHIIYFF